MVRDEKAGVSARLILAGALGAIAATVGKTPSNAQALALSEMVGSLRALGVAPFASAEFLAAATLLINEVSDDKLDSALWAFYVCTLEKAGKALDVAPISPMAIRIGSRLGIRDETGFREFQKVLQ